MTAPEAFRAYLLARRELARAKIATDAAQGPGERERTLSAEADAAAREREALDVLGEAIGAGS